MKRNFIFDPGFHHGEGSLYLTELYEVDRSWQIFTFEPNSACRRHLLRANVLQDPPVTGLAFAVGCRAGPALFSREAGQPGGLEDGQASHLKSIPLEVDHRGAGEEEVWCINFQLFLRALIPPRSKGEDRLFVVVKMDIEGAEYPILRTMLADGSIERIDVLHVEFHDRILPDETVESTAALRQELEK